MIMKKNYFSLKNLLLLSAFLLAVILLLIVTGIRYWQKKSYDTSNLNVIELRLPALDLEKFSQVVKNGNSEAFD